ncbi:MAG TPA: TIR domain-containing protein [Steroidobacteraceae bacterium]
MPESSKAVFLSYASQDAEPARRICEALRGAGIEVWFDQSELRGGDAWDQRIRRQIHDCALFIPLISANTASRHEGYFRLEWDLADQRTHMIARNRAFIVPVSSDATPNAGADVPESFLRVQWTRLPAGETPPGFVQRVSALLSVGVQSAGSPARPAANAPPSAPASSLSKLAPLLIAAAALLGIGYFALDEFVLSKRAPAPAMASLPAESAESSINEKSIAVLPFADLSEKKDQEYFSDGLADELLDLLAKTPGLRVIARTSSFSFKGKSDDIPAIARKLHVANILEGSVRKFGDRLRVTTQLIRASSGDHLWSETYDRQLKDVFAVQDEIAAAVVGQLRLKLAPMPSSGARRTSNIEAYNEYLRGQGFANRGNIEGRRLAIEAFRRAIVLDPTFVAPYDGLATAEFAIANQTNDAAGFQRAIDAAARAVELGPDDPNAYAARGFIRSNISWDWAGAQADYEKAIALDPGNGRFQSRYADLLATFGRLPEAIAVSRKAIELDPLRLSNLGLYLISARDFTAAHEAIGRELEMTPESPFVLNEFGILQLIEGKAQDALATFRKIDFVPLRLYGVAAAEHSFKDPNASQQALDELIAKHAAEGAYQVAEVYAWRGEKDKAFEWLDRAFTQQDNGLTSLKADPLMDSLRGDPRYKTFLRKMKLPE